ncbi:MAG: serine/threonine protein kinase [Pseudomonadota bacterium]
MLNEYQIKSVLGKPGGFGITYLATDTHLHQSVAIKEYLPSDFAIREGVCTVFVKSSSDEESFQWGLKCFTDEARILAKFNHNNIVKVLRFFEANGTAYMVMEYQEGKSLVDYLKQRRITEKELLTIVLPLLNGLEEVHKVGLSHRDIKPSNIYIRSSDNSPVLLDFGSARYTIGRKTRSITSIVTPGYAPLEQYDTEMKNQGAWTDIYALGAVMYYAINGEAPPAATSRVNKDPMIPAVKLGKGHYNNRLLKSIDWALQLSQEDRPQTVALWRDKMLDHTPTTVYSAKPSFQSPWSFINVASIAVILLLFATVALLFNKNNSYNNEIQKERMAHQSAVAQLEREQERCQAGELNHQEAMAVVAEIQRFNPQTASGFKYYKIINVASDYVLNIREFPGRSNQVIRKIPPTEKCIKFLGDYCFLKSRVWIKIQYKQMQGWINSSYLAKNEEGCNGF